MFGKLKYHLLLAVMVLLTATSCQRVIDLKLDNAEPQLVIEGIVTSQLINQTVKISQSVPFSNSNVFPAVSGAIVTIADNHGNTYSLTEGIPGTYSSAKFQGRVGYTYTLTVQTNSKVYTATSTMPFPVRFDDLSYKDDFFSPDKKIMTVHYQDPLNVANNYHFLLFVNSVQAKTVFVNDDNFSNGKYVDFDLYQNKSDIKVGDNVLVEAQCIDRNMFFYWFSLSQQQDNGNGPTPSNPPSNLSNGALGYFSAHTVQRLAVTIK
ncbi:MAG: DUF4249 domain-containing protein [Mucilaginibacter sp.]